MAETLSIGPHQPVSNDDPLKEYWDQFNKIGSTVLNTVIPDFTNPAEVSEALLDMKMALKVGKHPVAATGLYIGKRAARRLAEPVISNIKGLVNLPKLATEGIDAGTGGAKAMQNASKLTTGAGKPARNVTRKLSGSQLNAAITPEGVLNRYGVYKTVDGKRVRVPLDDELPTPGRKEQHHWIPKDVRNDFTVQAKKLDPKGQSILDAIDIEYDLQAGGGSKGVTTMDMMAHLPMHGRIKGAGYEVSGKLLKEFREEIAGIKDIEQLKTVYRTWLEKNVVPTVSTVQALQGGYEMLEAGGKGVSKEALLEAAYGRGGWVDRQLSAVENRIERAYEQGVTPRRSDILFKVRAEQDALNNLSL